jgi:hypothetical protein
MTSEGERKVVVDRVDVLVIAGVEAGSTAPVLWREYEYSCLSVKRTRHSVSSVIC